MIEQPCTCQRGLYCADGQRGQFVRGSDRCALCGDIAWRHSTSGKPIRTVTK